MTTKKTDKPVIHADLDKLAKEADGSANIDQFTFTFKGKRFVCQNPYDFDLMGSAGLSADDILGQLELFLGEKQFEDFKAKKPQMRHAYALMKHAEDYYAQFYGNPGESDGSQES